MRLALRHPPPDEPPPRLGCRHLELLAEAATGVPLGPAARLVAPARSRGRHGNALQWHFGLESHDGDARLDWEDRIEIKLVSVWRRPNGIGCDKLKVCDVSMDPWHKVANVLWVFADRLTRVVVGHRLWHLGPSSLERLARAWNQDPHFERPDLFVEAREHDDRASPAYYLAASWFQAEGILPTGAAGVFPFDSKWFSAARSAGGGRDPLMAAVPSSSDGSAGCPRCDGVLSFDAVQLSSFGWAPAIHAMPHGDGCALREHAVVDAGRLPPTMDRLEQTSGLAGSIAPEHTPRVSDRVLEPEDHLH